MALVAGTRLGPYKILEPLGAGGMGEVYRAEDPRLSRTVAIKILPEHLSGKPEDFSGKEEARERFEREARAVAALSHPHILSIFDFGCDQGIWYAVTELLLGETLRNRMLEGPLSWRETVEIGIEIAEGLSSAHSKGIIHRDIKPENIFITTEGHVKILDFGLARWESSKQHEIMMPPQQELTEAGALVGTYPYMSPEQVQGISLTGASDLFSLGCMLYEMVSGYRPFLRDTPEDTLIAILQEDPLEIPGESIPRQLQQVIRHCLEKNPQKRYQTAHDLALALKAIERGEWQSSSGSRRLWPSIAVLPFIDLSPEKDLEYFCDGIAEELIHALSRLRGLYVTSRTSAFQFKQKSVDVRLIGQQLNAATILEGSVRKSGNRYRITAKLINTADGYQVWSDRYDREIQDIFEVQEEIAGAIVENLKIKLAADFDQPLVKRYTEDLEAYHSYLKGRYFWAKRYEAGLSKAMEFYVHAIEKDLEYAPAYAGMADCYTILGSYGFLPSKTAFDQARAAAEKALALDETLPEAHVAVALIHLWYDWSWEQAERSFQRALELNPNDSLAHIWYATFLSMLGRFPEVKTEIRRAQKLDPLSPLVNSLAGCALYMARSYDEALLEFQKAFDVDPDFLVALSFIGGVYLQKSMFREAQAAAERAVKLSSRSSFSLASYGSVLAAQGRTEEAQALLEELHNRSGEQYVPAFCFSMIYTGMRDYDHAFEFLEKALEQKNIQICFLKESPGLDPLRSDPRFKTLLDRVSFP